MAKIGLSLSGGGAKGAFSAGKRAFAKGEKAGDDLFSRLKQLFP